MSQRLTSYEALVAKRNQNAQANESQRDHVEIRVAMGTCAIATGAKDVFDALKETIESNDIQNIALKATGCMGYCYAEPTVEVVGVTAEPVMFGHVDADIAKKIISEYIQKREPVNARIDTCHVNA